MRIRSLKPEFFTDRITGRWPAELALFYQGLWVLADDEGRFEWEPDAIKGRLFPYRSGIAPVALLEELRKSGHVVKYFSSGQHYGWLPKFRKHQHPNKPQESRLPDPSHGTTVALPDDYGSANEPLPPVEESRVGGLECTGEERRDLASLFRYPDDTKEQCSCQSFEARKKKGIVGVTECEMPQAAVEPPPPPEAGEGSSAGSFPPVPPFPAPDGNGRPKHFDCEAFEAVLDGIEASGSEGRAVAPWLAEFVTGARVDGRTLVVEVDGSRSGFVRKHLPILRAQAKQSELDVSLESVHVDQSIPVSEQ